MNKLILLLIVFSFVFAASNLFAADGIETIVLKSENRVDFMEKMESNNLFLGRISDVDVDDENNFYFLQRKYCSILKVDSRTGKLIKTISSKGQGPQELMEPKALRVRNQKIFVADRGFGGVKIFNSTDGKLFKAFKTKHTEVNWLDVNQKNEIYVLEFSGNPTISVYNMEGEKLRKAIDFPMKKKNDLMDYWVNLRAKFILDSRDNVIVLFASINKIRKYNTDGGLLWEQYITNTLLEDVPWEAPRYDKNGALHCNEIAYELEIDQEDNIILGHLGGGAIYNKGGEIMRLLKYDWDMTIFKLFENGKKILILSGPGFRIHIDKFKIGGQ